MEAAAALLLVILLQLVSQLIGLFPGVVLLVPKVLPALLVFSVGVDQTRRLDGVLVVLKRAVSGGNCVVRVNVELGSIRSEGRDACVSRGVGLSLVGKGLVPSVDESCSIIGAL